MATKWMSKAFMAALLFLVLLVAAGWPQAQVQAQGTQATEITGELDVIIKDDFARGKSDRDYFLRDSKGGSIELKFKKEPPHDWISGKKIKAKGTPRGRVFEVDEVQDLDPAKPASSINGTADAMVDAELGYQVGTPVVHKTIVMMVNLSNASLTETEIAAVPAQMYTGPRNVAAMFEEASLGQTVFNMDSNGDGRSDIYGPITIASDNTTCNYGQWAAEAEAAVTAQGVNLTDFKYRLFVLPHYSKLPQCSWAGIANLGCGTFCRAWVAEPQSGMVYAHEIGHNLGLHHAGNDPGNDGVIDVEYGDYSDVMGLSRAWHVFNAAHVDQMKWYAPIQDAVQTVTLGGTYSIGAIGTNFSNSLPKALRIHRPVTNDFLYLSFRQASNYDASLSTTYTRGVNIHRYKGSGAFRTAHITTLINGVAFSDAESGASIYQVSAMDGVATLQVSFGECVAPAPAVSVAPTSVVVRANTVASASVSVTSLDRGDCQPARFVLSQTGSPTTVTFSAGEHTLSGGQVGNAALDIGPVSSDGRYSIVVKATDSDGADPNRGFAQTTLTLTVDGTPPSTPAAPSLSLNKQSKVVVTWTTTTDTGSGLASYAVYRDGALIGTVNASTRTLTDTSVVSGQTHTYQMSATDMAGNESPLSVPSQISVGSKTTGGGSTGGGKKR